MAGETRSEPSSQTVPLELIDSAPFQIRPVDEEEVRSLAASMKERGLLEPVLVRRRGERFQVVAGERRVCAAKLLQWSAIDCRVCERSELDAALDKYDENEERKGTTPLQRARFYAHLRDELHLDQEEIAERLRVHKSVVSRLLALLKQPEKIRQLVADESISPAHLRALQSIADEPKRIELAEQVAKQRLTVRQTERRVREAARSTSAKTSEAAIASAPAESTTRVDEERSSAAPLSATVPTEMQKTAARESTSSVPSPEAIVEQPKLIPAAAQSTLEHVPQWEIERRMQLSATSVPTPTIEQRIANWCSAVGSLVRGPLGNAFWEFYERLTEAATWWRMLKAVGKFLARFLPGAEPRPTKPDGR